MDIAEEIKQKKDEIKVLAAKIENAEKKPLQNSSKLDNLIAKELVLNNQLLELYRRIPKGKQTYIYSHHF